MGVSGPCAMCRYWAQSYSCQATMGIKPEMYVLRLRTVHTATSRCSLCWNSDLVSECHVLLLASVVWHEWKYNGHESLHGKRSGVN